MNGGNSRSGEPLCGRPPNERYFVEALLLHCRQKWRESPAEPVKMTHNQIMEIVESRHGVKLDPTQFNRLKRKYVTSLPEKPGGMARAASRFELLRELVKGHIGVPSEYEMTGLQAPVIAGAGG